MKIAVIKTGGKQYLVTEGDTLNVEKLGMESGTVSFETLLTDDGEVTEVGAPLVSGKVTGTVVSEGKAKKINVVKYKAKSRYFKKRGHRQPFTKIKIEAM